MQIECLRTFQMKNNQKHGIVSSKKFEKQLKRIVKQGKDINKIKIAVKKLANHEILDAKYKDHQLKNTNIFKGCRECHIEPDWLLVYKYNDNLLILYLVATGSHSNILNM